MTTWEWYYFKLNPSEARHISDLAKHRKMLSPTVQKNKGKYSLKFTFEENKSLVDNTNPLSYTILSVDLGINAPASWAIMTADGTVHAKGVIHLGCDEDRLNRLVNRKRQYQAQVVKEQQRTLNWIMNSKWVPEAWKLEH